jgi:phosphomannomutase
MLKMKVDGTRQGVEKKTSALKKLFPRSKMSTLDGIKISGSDWWVQIRASNTEPIVRLMAEAKDRDRANELLAAVKSVL